MSLFDALLLDPAPFHLWISIRSDGQKGSGLVTDPYDGSKVGSIYRFDEVMAGLSSTANVVVHLGPGTFPTQGYGGTTAAWQVHAGMKILGSGVEITTLLLNVASAQASRHYFAVGHDVTGAGAKSVDAFEISDLSIDVNLSAHTAESAFGAIRVMGNNARVRRVKITHWGTLDKNIACYGISMLSGMPDSGTPALREMSNFGIEDCSAMVPGTSVDESKVNAFNIGFQSDLSSVAEAQAKSPFVRNCYLNGGVIHPDIAPTRALMRAVAMGWCRGGVMEGNQIYDFDVGGPYAGGGSFDSQLTVRDLVVRNNVYRNVARALQLSFDKSSLINTGNVSLAIASGVGMVSGTNLNVAKLSSGDRVSLVTTGGSHAGMYQVRNVISAASSSFEITPVLSTPTPVTVTSVFKLKGVTRAIVESNTVELAAETTAGIMAFEVNDDGAAVGPDFWHGEILLRNNRVRYVDAQSGGGYSGKCSRIQGAKTVQVNNSLVASDPSNPLENARCGAVMYFNNRKPTTQLIQGFNSITSSKYDELETLAEDAFVLAFAED